MRTVTRTATRTVTRKRHVQVLASVSPKALLAGEIEDAIKSLSPPLLVTSHAAVTVAVARWSRGRHEVVTRTGHVQVLACVTPEALISGEIEEAIKTSKMVVIDGNLSVRLKPFFSL